MEFNKIADTNNLIGRSIKKEVHKIISKKTGGGTISDGISSTVSDFYNKCIKNNFLVVLVLGTVTIMLVYRYYNKKSKVDDSKSEKKEEIIEEDSVGRFTKEEYDIMKDIMVDQTKHLKYDEQPSFDRLQSVNSQQEHVNYPPSPIPLNVPGQGLIEPKYDYSPQYTNLNNPTYDYNNVYQYPDRSYYHGTLNTYQNAQDTDITNPLGFSNQFNTTTGDFIGGMTSANKDNVVEYQKMLANMRNELTNSLKVGPNQLDPNAVDNTIIPPYSTDI